MKKFVGGIVFVLIVFSVGMALAGNVNVGVLFPMTGAVAAYGEQAWTGVKLAHQLEPAVLGKKVKLVLVDDKSDKVEAANGAARLIENNKVVAIVGPVTTPNTLAAGPIAEKAHIPIITPSATNVLVTEGKKYVFRVCFIDPFQGKVAAIYAAKNLKAKKAAVLFDIGNAYSVGLAKAFKESFQKLGGKVVGWIHFQTGDQDFTAQLTDLSKKKFDVLYVPGWYTEDALIAKQARELGINVPILSGDGAQAAQLIKIGGKAVEGLTITTHFAEEAAATPLGKKFVSMYRKQYKGTPPALAALGFDAYMVLMDAIKRAKSFDPQKIRNAIASTKRFKGATGVITIDKYGNAVKSAVIEKVKNGKFVYVTTINP